MVGNDKLGFPPGQMNPPQITGTDFTDPLRCSVCQNTMRVIAVIDDRRVVEKILRHLGVWCGGPLLRTGRSPPGDGPWSRVPYGDVDPMPDYENVLTD